MAAMPIAPPTRAFALWTLFAASFATIAVVAFLWSRQSAVLDHFQARQLILYYMLSRFDDPVIVLGDSLTEASTLPRSVCGRPLLNAGINGAATTDDLGKWLTDALAGKRAAMIVVALGTNDALAPNPKSPESFAKRYVELLGELSRLTPKLAFIGIPPVQQKDRLSGDLKTRFMRSIDAYNAVLPEISQRSGVPLMRLDDFPASGTIDGVHLSAEGYQAWDKAILRAAQTLCP